MKYSDNQNTYTIIIEDDTDFMMEQDVNQIDDEKYEFTGTLQQFGEMLESCGYRQEDIKEHIEEFESSGFKPNSGLDCWVQPADCYFYLKK